MRWVIEKSAGDNLLFVAVSVDDGREGMSYENAIYWVKQINAAMSKTEHPKHKYVEAGSPAAKALEDEFGFDFGPD